MFGNTVPMRSHPTQGRNEGKGRNNSRTPNHWRRRRKVPTMSQALSSIQCICFRKISGSNIGASNLLLALGAVWPRYVLSSTTSPVISIFNNEGRKCTNATNIYFWISVKSCRSSISKLYERGVKFGILQASAGRTSSWTFSVIQSIRRLFSSYYLICTICLAYLSVYRISVLLNFFAVVPSKIFRNLVCLTSHYDQTIPHANT